ncbi:hypothetical protein K457DRAFT_588801 [Linnemannia elongata AG-77]|uniref:Uncharacterized protein n=1 Tax=Linnemannia elongata AG-77 TaxID=1314771 RepID=A0A197JSL9_9FUNG|nr:hypothetical protein K457DRAFT_588801 [Linnemannia elongata AG-77]
MHIPIPRSSSSPSALDLLDLQASGASAGAGLFNTDTTTEVGVPTAPGTTTRRHRDSISFFLPIFILTILLIILILSLVFARCLYRRFKAMHPSSSTSTSSWKAYSSTNYGSNDQSHNHHDHGENSDTEEEDERTEQERLLARRRSTSYYDANRSRAPVAVVIQHDAKGRPISTWSTASSVAAQRGEELSRWSRRRDDLIKIYGQSNMNTNSFAEEDGPDEEDEQEDGGSHSVAYGYHQQGLSVEGEDEGWMGSQSWVRAMRTATTTTTTTTVKPALKPTRVRTHSWIHSNNATPKAVRDRQGSPPPQHPHSKNSSMAGLSLPLSRIRTLTHTHTQKENKILAIPTTCKKQVI